MLFIRLWLIFSLKLIIRIIGGSGILEINLERGEGFKNIGIINDTINVLKDKKKNLLLRFKMLLCFILHFLFRFAKLLLIE